MTNFEREKIKNDYIENVYKKSWTFKRLTELEKTKILDNLYNLKLFANDKKNLAYELHAVYSAFLDALDYKPTGWREKDGEELLF